MTLIDPHSTGVGIRDITDVDDLTTTFPVIVQRHGDRIILNLSGDAAEVLAHVVATHDAAGREPFLMDPWLNVLTRLIIGAAVVAETPASMPPPPRRVDPNGAVLVPVLGKAR